MSSSKYFFGLFILLTIYLDVVDPFVAFTPASTHGIFAALAVPLELPHRNVFVSYNFEANYNLPEKWDKWTIFQNGPIESEEVVDTDADAETDTDTGEESSRKLADGCHNCTKEESNQGQDKEEETETPRSERKVRSLLTRTNIYRIFIDKLKRSGFQGESCLLRLICETTAAQLDEFNGVLGSIMHVLLSPSTSESENLPLRYYQAEHDGWNDHCHFYEPGCGESLLELVSEPFEAILNHIETNKV
ncbi:uncharacterized protein Dana_GF27681 [Drosophila ananassae]|uniref:DUF4780 domain-containing protein n=1 Tax=Drosophila ananassae TaxID=7217 RepID=A0A0N8P0E6_DROAN|nr:uncharacterized protein LOC26515090 [Drosophila ananassae]KPU76908.1 uncharacterized protein Dana_GF27681 [Drosophila ananassae]